MIGKTFYSLKSCTAVKIQNGYSTIHAHQYRTACLTGPKKRFNDIFFWLNSIFFLLCDVLRAKTEENYIFYAR